MKLGEIELIALTDGTFGLDGGAMFGIVPKPLWEKLAPPDEANRIRCATNVLLIVDGNRKILIDTGIGDRWDEKNRRIYAIEKESGSLERSFAQHGIRPEEITDVIATHLHFDHQGGSVVESEDGRLLPRFPNAVYHYQKSQLAWARHPSVRDRGSFRASDFEPVVEADQVMIHDGEYELTPHVKVEVKNGHTTGLQAVHIYSAGKTVYYCSDMIPLSPHIRLPYIMGYDLRPLVTLEEKNEVLEKAAQYGWWVYLEHDPNCVAVKVERTVKDFAVVERITREEWNKDSAE